MKCDPIRAWLLSARLEEAAPRGVYRHVRGCPECRKFLRRLRRADRAASVPVHAPSEKMVSAIQDRLAPRPQSPAPPAPRRRAPWLAVAALVFLSFTVGWLGRAFFDPATPTPTRRVDPENLARLAEVHADLAGSYDGRTQIRLLEALAEELREACMRLARAGAVEELPLWTTLHDRVLKDGVARRTLALSASIRPEIQGHLLTRLRGLRQRIADQTEDLTPELVAFLDPLGRSATETAEFLEHGGDAPATVALPDEMIGPGNLRAVLIGLVVSSVGMADDLDPFRRADQTVKVIDQLNLASRVAYARGDERLARELEQTRDEMVRRGLAPNLQRARLSAPDDPRLPDLNETIQRNDAKKFPAPGFGAGKMKQGEKEKGKGKSDRADKSDKGPTEKREIKGVVCGIDSELRTICIAVRDKDLNFEVTYRVPVDVRVRSGPRDLPLRYVPVGANTKIKLRDATTVEEIRLE